ncbi:MAG: tRNA (adenosine(37)-N6)-threonylcarbamoyltransferase complex dimerization subunit type 1 TsaB [Planctomycetota bacterium]|jgi:tRNA threonylcarbamoyladenosine biosynthesis protein TsaB|nr:tRNA (adenosine(37)-N6)-threonylcarbamoyltransferase complex dimerization subunit type 1 TsaB [Planctomycetota bacterium]
MANRKDAAPRHLLALESSTPEGGVALLREGELIGSARLSGGLRHGRELLPAASAILERAGLAPASLWAVAVSAGPGSYTGLRVGVMAAKALAYGTGCRLIAVSSLAALAASLQEDGVAAMAAQDARRDEVYAGLYRLENGDASPLAADAAMTPEEARDILARRLDKGEGTRLIGSGFSSYPGLFRDLGGAAAAEGRVDPAATARLGWRRLLRGEADDPMRLQPIYLRRDAGADWARDRLIG